MCFTALWLIFLSIWPHDLGRNIHSRESGCPPSCLVRDNRTTRDPRVLAASRVVMVAGIEWFRPAPLLGVMR